ncbi:pyrroline-5-carboxylate reductase [Synchytrium microbalum]|uniref:Pyrroline-5-carboxylate reductase n=1 Tax=Synchytrium microbalum TaxID=1806994 RepID=A0A507BVV0_9FUNG|nr:pyrroline-5-carboxylate reductase [Synchytrium microbalum]TPX33500.1 pyrroline-5-carboxylate reductase [Synchytrium microbalum]
MASVKTALDTSKRIAFIGGGNMASAMIGGLLANAYPASNIVVSEPIQERAAHLKSHFKVGVASTNEDAVNFTGHYSQKPADIVILAVKPQVMKPVASSIAKVCQSIRPLVITIAAGIRTPDLNRWLSSDENGVQLPSARNIALVRAMPNTPALVLEGATALFAGLGVTQQQKQETYNVIDSVSNRTYWVEQENLLDVVTALSGTGPAYFFLLIECLEQAAVQLGLPKEVAKGLAAQTALGAGKMAISSPFEPRELRLQVTSPNGTTEAAMKLLESAGVRKMFAQAVVAAMNRSIELGELFGKDNQPVYINDPKKIAAVAAPVKPTHTVVGTALLKKNKEIIASAKIEQLQQAVEAASPPDTPKKRKRSSNPVEEIEATPKKVKSSKKASKKHQPDDETRSDQDIEAAAEDVVMEDVVLVEPTPVVKAPVEEKKVTRPPKTSGKKVPVTDSPEKLARTIFVGNVSTDVLEKAVLKEFKAIFSTYGRIESIRFRSLAFSIALPRKVSFIAKKLHPGRDTCHAYIVYAPTEPSSDKTNTTIKPAQAALAANGTEFHSKHLRVDGLSTNAEKHDRKRTVFVGNLDFTIADETLRAAFESCGDIHAVRVVRDKKTNLGKGIGYVTFTDVSCVSIALRMDGLEIAGRPVRVSRCEKEKVKEDDRIVWEGARSKRGDVGTNSKKKGTKKRREAERKHGGGKSNSSTGGSKGGKGPAKGHSKGLKRK